MDVQEQSDEIGRGRFGVVYLSFQQSSGDPIAEKQINLQCVPIEHRQRFLKDVSLIQNFLHKNVVSSRGFVINGSILHIYMEYVGGSDLQKILATQRAIMRPFDEYQTKGYLYQMMTGLAFLHERSLIHGDLKPTNILVSKTGIVKISDIGQRWLLAFKGAVDDQWMNAMAYIAPEVLRRQLFSRKSDLWSLGVIAFELVDLKLPFEAKNRNSLLNEIREGHLSVLQTNVSESLRSLVSSLLDRNVDKRPECWEMLKNEMFHSGQNITILPVQESENRTVQERMANKTTTQLGVIVCQEQGPLRTFILNPKMNGWIGSIRNVLAEGGGPVRVHRSSCLVHLGENSAMLVDSVHRKAYLTTDLLKGKWTEMESPKVKRSSASGVKVNEKVFLLGGSDGTSLSAVECFDFNRGNWSSFMPLPIATWNPTTVVGTHHKVLVMGRSPSEESSTRCIQILDSIEQWRLIDGVFSDDCCVVGGCEFHGKMLLCTEKNTLFLNWNSATSLFTTETLSQSPGACDSMTAWENVVAIAHKKKVWLLEPQEKRITELPPLPLAGGWNRSFAVGLARGAEASNS